RDEKNSELDSKLNRLHKRAKQQIQEVQKEKDDLQAKYKEVNKKVRAGCTTTVRIVAGA
nr:protein GRIP [Tanacetum cinerariifolium]